MSAKKSSRINPKSATSTAFNSEVSYMSLFPDTAFNNVSDAYSSTGPGAYFVSLMNLATNSDKIAPNVDEASLKMRRPDLWELQVSKTSTETMMPYLQKVNELLCHALDGNDPNKLWEKIARSETNFLPYNQPLQRIKAGLSAYATSLAELASDFSIHNYESLHWCLAELGLSRYELEILKKPEKEITDWAAPEIGTPEQLRIATGMDMNAMLQLIYNGGNSDQILEKLFINRNSPAPLKYKAYNGSDAEHFENLTREHLNRIRQFLILANGTGWDFSTLNAVLSSEHIWKEGIEQLESNLKRMAKLSYVSKALTLTAQSIIPVQAETGVLQTAAAISTTLAQENNVAQSNIVLDALKINKSLVKQRQNRLAEPTQNMLNVLLPVAARMGITVAQLELHFLFNKIETIGLEDLFSLVQLHNTLQKAGISLHQYIQVETATHYFVQSDVNFDTWLDVLRKKLTASESSHADDKTQDPTEKRNKEDILKAEQAEENLQQLLFQQWTHELAVYWGEKEAAVCNTMQGLSKYFAEKSDTGNGIGQFNNFIRNEEKHTVKNLLRSLFPYISLCNKLPMSFRAIAYAAGYLLPIDENSFTAEAFDLVHAMPIMQFNEVYNQVDTNKQEAYLAFLESNQFDNESLAKNLSQNLSWPEASITALLIAWKGKDSSKQSKKEEVEITPVKVVTKIEKLWHCFAAAQQYTLSVITLNEFAQLIDTTDWKNLTEQAEGFKVELQELNSTGQKERYKNALGEVLEKERDSLVQSVLWYFNQERGYVDINTPDHLSDFLLCDVEMSGIMQISPLQEATDAVQTYLTRCKSGMEKVDAACLKKITPSEWQWVASFDGWQAEQLIKAYPENYLQATVRTTATPQFEELTNELGKNELTEEQAETAVLNYLDEWVNLENAKIVDASCFKTYSKLYGKEVETFFMVSKSPKEENTFYLSRKECDTENDRSTWFPWEKIECSIHAETVSAVYAFNRLNIFWSELSSVSDTDQTVNGGNGKYTLHSAVIKAIYQNLDGSWTTPKTILEAPFYIDLAAGSELLNWGSDKEGVPIGEKIKKIFNPSNLYWKKPGVQTVKGFDSRFIVCFIGPFLSQNIKVDTYKPRLDVQAASDGKLRNFQDTISDNIDKACRITDDYTSVFCLLPSLLDSNLNPVIVKNNKSLCFPDLSTLSSPKICPVLNIGFTDVGLFEYKNIIVDTYFPNTKDIMHSIISAPEKLYFFSTIRNRIGSFLINTGNATYIFSVNIPTDYLDAFVIHDEGITFKNLPIELNATFKVERLTSSSINQLLQNANDKGVQIISCATQRDELGLPKTKFSDLNPDLQFVLPPKEDSDNKINFSGPFGIYARELFFHAPMAVAASLAGSFQYSASRNWYHKVFNALGVEEKNKKEVWQYLPFYDCKTGYLSIVWNKADNKICLSNGVDTGFTSTTQPYITYNDSDKLLYILGMKIVKKTESLYYIMSSDGGNVWNIVHAFLNIEYQKASGIFSSPDKLDIYINDGMMISCDKDRINCSSAQTINFIPKWAQLTTVDTTGKTNTLNPDLIADNNPEVYMRWTLEQYIRFILDAADRQFMQESWESLSAATQLYFEAEDLLGGKPNVKDLESVYEKENKRIYEYVQDISTSFAKPTNRDLKSLWDWVSDRLYKLRNGLNINGERQLPSTNDAAAEPWRLVLSLRNSRVNPNTIAELYSGRTVYRFRDLIPATETIIYMVAEFGNQLYNALIQKDNEQLQALQATHQVNLLNVTKKLYDYQVSEATKEVESLRKSSELTQAQYNYYSSLIRQGNLPQEIQSLSLSASAATYQFAGAVTHTGAVVAYLMPNIFGLADGGMEFGQAVSTVAAGYADLASGLQTTSQILATQAEYTRRNEEWRFQQEQSLLSLNQLNKSIEAAQIRLNIAIENRNLYHLQLKQANEILSYLNTKFTNAELFSWMSGKMSSLYFTAYQLALTGLHKLQAAYNYELDLTDSEQGSFIPANAWDSVKKGLLAGESLKLALATMQNAYLNKNVRKQQAEKVLSLKQNVECCDWQKFIGGKCKEEDIHYIQDTKDFLEFNISRNSIGNNKASVMKIKSISVSIPAVLGPYETFDAILENTVTKERITISRGVDDYGVFPEDMQDGRYMPFEGFIIPDAKEKSTSSDWRFSLPSLEVRKKIADVIISIKYCFT